MFSVFKTTPSFDVTTLPLPVVVDLVIANLQSISDAMLDQAMQRTRANLTGSAAPAPTAQASREAPAAPDEAEAVVNPLISAPLCSLIQAFNPLLHNLDGLIHLHLHPSYPNPLFNNSS